MNTATMRSVVEEQVEDAITDADLIKAINEDMTVGAASEHTAHNAWQTYACKVAAASEDQEKRITNVMYEASRSHPDAAKHPVTGNGIVKNKYESAACIVRSWRKSGWDIVDPVTGLAYPKNNHPLKAVKSEFQKVIDLQAQLERKFISVMAGLTESEQADVIAKYEGTYTSVLGAYIKSA